MRRTLPGILLYGVLASVAGHGVRAQGGGAAEDRAVTLRSPNLFHLHHADVSEPLRDMPLVPPQQELRVPHPVKLLHPPRPVDAAWRDPLVPRAAAPAPKVNVGRGPSFDGIGVGLGGFRPTSAPPDTSGAAGLAQYVQWVNTSFAVFDKASGALLFGPAAGGTLWQGFGGPCEANNDGDPTPVYDRIANRWVMTQFSVSGGRFFQCVAVSTSPDATGSYRRFAFQFQNFNDYPKIAVWPDAYYISFNMFNPAGTAFLGARVCALDRERMLAAGAAPGPMQCFQVNPSLGALLPSDQDGPNPPPGSPSYFLTYGTNVLRLWKFHVDWTTPSASTFTGPTDIPVAPFSEACGGGTCIPQPGSSLRLDSLADRPMYRLAYRNRGGQESLVVNHSVAAAGTASAVRWYEIRSPGGTPTLFQQGSFAPDATARWMGSIAMDRAGNMLLGYSASSSSVRPSIRVTGRLAGDPPGTMQAELEVQAGGGSQILGSLTRWGDYSMMTVDPADDCTFWFTTEYLKTNGAFNWSTRIAAFRFPTCGDAPPTWTVSVAPAALSVARGAAAAATVTVRSLGGFRAATMLSASGLPAGVTASFAPNPVTPPPDGTVEATLTLTASAEAAAGSFDVTIVSAAGPATRTAGLRLTVEDAAGCATAAAGQGFQNRPLGAVQTGTFTVEFDATPSAAPINSVIALSRGAQNAHVGFAAQVRFGPNGTIDARNGGAYAAATAIRYAAGVSHRFRLVVNVAQRRYSIFVTPGGGAEVAVGSDFAFRTEQAAVTQLDNWAAWVSAAPPGQTRVCNLRISPALP